MRIEDLARYPLPGYALPTGWRFAPGDAALTFLDSPEAGLRMALFAADPETGARRVLLDPREGGVREGQVSLEEALRRERLRQRSIGVTSYQWAEKAPRLLVPLAGRLLVADGVGAAVRELVPAGTPPALDARLSPDGAHVAFVRDAELYVVPFEGGTPVQVTHGARGTGRTHGLAEYAAQEEMHRHEGFWWSDDGSFLAFEEADETHIPVYRIVHQGKDEVGETAQEDHRYPFAGAANAKVRIGVVARPGPAPGPQPSRTFAPGEGPHGEGASGGDPVWMDLGDPEYVARVKWAPDGTLWVQTQDRLQQRLDLLRCDPRTGRSTRVLSETSRTWINLHQCLRFVPDCAALPGSGFLWASERDGFQHLYLHDAAGAPVRQVTSGPWMVDAIAGLDPARGLVWVTGTLDGPTERHLYECRLDDSRTPPRRLTAERGTHDVILDHAKRRFVDLHSATDRPPRVELKALDDGRVLHVLHGTIDPRIAELGLVPPELHTLRSRDGATLHAAVYRPRGNGPAPVVVSVYGGPHVQRVQDSWELTAGLRSQHYRELGFAVLVVDNRGSARRGVAFESPIHRNMGDLEVRDQEDGVRWLAAKGWGDPARVGIVGWSYGGYMAAMCLARAPETFRCACAGAPVTHWDGYDTHYTERYMGTPQDNAEGYRASSVLQHVPQIEGSLLLVHGMLDENVHFRHTARLVNALNRARKRYEILVYPDERHMPRGEADRIQMEERIRDWFVRELAPGVA